MKQQFDSAIPTAIAAGLGALHIKDRMASLNEVEIDEILPAIGKMAKKAGGYIASKSDELGDSASKLAKSAAKSAGRNFEDVSDQTKRLAKIAGNYIQDKAEDGKDMASDAFKSVKKGLTRIGDRGILVKVSNRMEDAQDNVKSLGKTVMKSATRFGRDMASDAEDSKTATSKAIKRFVTDNPGDKRSIYAKKLFGKNVEE